MSVASEAAKNSVLTNPIADSFDQCGFLVGDSWLLKTKSPYSERVHRPKFGLRVVDIQSAFSPTGKSLDGAVGRFHV